MGMVRFSATHPHLRLNTEILEISSSAPEFARCFKEAKPIPPLIFYHGKLDCPNFGRFTEWIDRHEEVFAGMTSAKM